MVNKTALVIGATGLVGSQLIRLLLKDDRFSLIKAFVRRSTGIRHSKFQEFIVSFDHPEEWHQNVSGDVAFSALGTTIKTAGSKEAQYKVDHTYQYQFALAASQHKVPVYVLVSAAMAHVNSRIFYSRMKGELERDIKILPFQSIHILQPGMLSGNRKEVRMGEQIGTRLIRFLNKLGIAKQQKPIDASLVAQAMINASFHTKKPLQVYTLLQVFDLASSKYPA